MEGNEIERQRKRFWSKERRSHHWRWTWAVLEGEHHPVGFLLSLFFLLIFLINSIWLLGKEGKKIMVSQFC